MTITARKRLCVDRIYPLEVASLKSIVSSSLDVCTQIHPDDTFEQCKVVVGRRIVAFRAAANGEKNHTRTKIEFPAIIERLATTIRENTHKPLRVEVECLLHQRNKAHCRGRYQCKERGGVVQ